MACQPVFEELCVNANGEIVCSSCDVNGQRVYGDVLTDRIAEVWDGPMYQDMRRWLLASRPDSWCPAINYQCPRRTEAVPGDHGLTGFKIRTLKLEPASHCNLACPVCPVVTNFEDDPELRAGRAYRMLSLETMLDVVAQLPDLETLYYFNFGEPFLNKATIPFLREMRRLRPNVRILTNTNGLAVGPSQIRALAGEALMDKIVVSIDGAWQESYRRYRVGGDVERALSNLAALAEASRQAGTRDRMDLTWQYILFEWNDSEAEIAEAKRRAEEMDVPIAWVITTGYGASKRFLPGSDAVAALAVGVHSVNVAAPADLAHRLDGRGIDDFSTYRRIEAACDLLSLPYALRAGGWSPVQGEWPDKPGFQAALSVSESLISAPAGTHLTFDFHVRNRTPRSWDPDLADHLRLGVLLSGEEVGTTELPSSVFLPREAARAGAAGNAALRVALPNAPGRYRLTIDVVQEGKTWFFERGSTPLVVALELT